MAPGLLRNGMEKSHCFALLLHPQLNSILKCPGPLYHGKNLNLVVYDFSLKHSNHYTRGLPLTSPISDSTFEAKATNMAIGKMNEAFTLLEARLLLECRPPSSSHLTEAYTLHLAPFHLDPHMSHIPPAHGCPRRQF